MIPRSLGVYAHARFLSVFALSAHAFFRFSERFRSSSHELSFTPLISLIALISLCGLCALFENFAVYVFFAHVSRVSERFLVFEVL